jgi:hypothetical protein
MPTPLNSPHSRISWLAIGVVSAAVFAVAASAANAPAQKPPIINVVVTQGPTTVTNKAPSHPSTTATTSGNRSGMGPSGSRGPSTPTQAVVNKATDSQFTFTVTNMSKTDYTGITIEYHVYNKTITHNNGLSTTTVSDITDTVPVPPPGDDGTAKPLAAGAKYDVVTKDIPGMEKTPTASSPGPSMGSPNGMGGPNGGMPGGGGRKSSTKTAEAVIPDTTTVMGSSYIVYWNGKPIGVDGEDPFGVIDAFKQFQGAQH